MVRTLATRVMLTLMFVAAFASAQTIVPLNTGYNHAAFAPYPPVTTSISTTRDDYWINIASYPPTSPPVDRAFVLQTPTNWQAALAGSSWIGPRNQDDSATGVDSSNPGYTLFRKCFCLLPNYNSPQLSFSVRADDTVQAWFNSQVNVLLSPQFGSFNGAALTSLPSNPAWFHAGVNCLYVLVEDDHGVQTGFDLAGTIQANGLAPLPASGVNQTFSCPCTVPPATNPQPPDVTGGPDDGEVVAELIRIAETRRRNRMRLR